MSSQSSDVESVVSAVKWIGIVLGVAAVVAVCTIVYMCCYRTDTGSAQSELMDGLLRRDQLEETELEDEGKGWQCVVCGLANSAKRKTCLMCGTSIGFLMSTELGRRKSSRMLLRNNSRGITGADVAGGAGEEEDMEALRVRQRALFKRRMNTMAARKSLSQRQRVPLGPANSTDAVDPLPELQGGDSAQATLPSTAEATSLAGPNGESVTDYHNLRSQGFVSMYDATGRLTWTKADEVSIDMESFGKGLDNIDFEGVMALSFRMKKQWFLVQLSRIATPVTEAVAKLMTRERIIQQSLQLAEAPPDALHAYLKITFDGEPGIDAGGLLREWFGIVCKQIFSEKMGLFVPTKGEDMSYWIDPLSDEKNETHLKLFRLAGILIGKALFEGLVLDAHLALPLLKHVLGIPISFSDLEFLDEELHRNCKWLRSNNHVEALCLTFSVMLENGTEVDLKENGRNVDVTDENKEEYLRLVLEHRMLDSIADQLQEFLMGIYDVVPKALLSVFDYQELELILCGIPTIDTADWKAHTHVRYIKPEENRKGNITEERAERSAAVVLDCCRGSCTRGTCSAVAVCHWNQSRARRGLPWAHELQRYHPPVHDPARDAGQEGEGGPVPQSAHMLQRLDLPMYRDMEELERSLTMVSQMEVFGFGLE
ncbi:E3 ubiquitin-protein ligase TOM1-like [Phytophthora ramorum]|uniref:E3 ubiquitin-protein ligase TOM1-like n=1 Tax=Phytophthora ramorum TaxID=164328 RepID=UPI0030B29742|nr:E3 ubiquitin-protein ligase TOM1-like [Phytophthora ramorum]